MRLVNAILTDDGVNVTLEKIMAKFVRDAEVLKTRTVDVRRVRDGAAGGLSRAPQALEAPAA